MWSTFYTLNQQKQGSKKYDENETTYLLLGFHALHDKYSIKPRLVQLALELFKREKMNDCIRPHDSVALRIWLKAEYVEDEDHAL